MARKDLLKDLMAGKPAEDHPAPTPLPRSQRGAIGAVSQSIADLKSRALIEVPTELIDMAGLADRMDGDPQGIAALKASILDYGQQVPVLLRHSPTAEGRFDIVFGRRRVQALKELRLPVKAMVRDLNDHDLVIAQGQENSARKDLSFIEKANFAAQMQRGGYDRKVICDALSIDKTVISRMLSIIEALPEGLVAAIGAAPSAGRDRWLALAERVRGHPAAELIAAATGADSDTRFLAVLAAATPSTQKRAPALPAPLTGVKGTTLGKVTKTHGKAVIELTGEGRAFADWLLDHIEDLHRDWSDKSR